MVENSPRGPRHRRSRVGKAQRSDRDGRPASGIFAAARAARNVPSPGQCCPLGGTPPPMLSTGTPRVMRRKTPPNESCSCVLSFGKRDVEQQVCNRFRKGKYRHRDYALILRCTHQFDILQCEQVAPRSRCQSVHGRRPATCFWKKVFASATTKSTSASRSVQSQFLRAFHVLI